MPLSRPVKHDARKRQFSGLLIFGMLPNEKRTWNWGEISVLIRCFEADKTIGFVRTCFREGLWDSDKKVLAEIKKLKQKNKQKSARSIRTSTQDH